MKQATNTSARMTITEAKKALDQGRIRYQTDKRGVTHAIVTNTAGVSVRTVCGYAMGKTPYAMSEHLGPAEGKLVACYVCTHTLLAGRKGP